MFIDKCLRKCLRNEGYLSNDTAVILSNLEISCEALDIAKKINPKETIKGLLEEFAFCIQ